MQVIEVSTMSEELFNRYCTPEQRQYLDQRREILGDECIQQIQQEYQDIFAAVKAEMDKGTELIKSKNALSTSFCLSRITTTCNRL